MAPAAGSVLVNARPTFAAVVCNDDDVDILLVAADVAAANISTMPDPGGDITSLTKVLVAKPGRCVSVNQGMQSLGLRAVTGTVPAVTIFTLR